MCVWFIIKSLNICEAHYVSNKACSRKLLDLLYHICSQDDYSFCFFVQAALEPTSYAQADLILTSLLSGMLN